MALERELRSRAVDHAAGKLSTDAYLAEHTRVSGEIEGLRRAKDATALVERDLEGLVEYLTNVSRMWAHPEATHEERKAFVLEVLEEADLGENRILRIRPRADYRELFRAGAYRKSVTYGRGERTETRELGPCSNSRTRRVGVRRRSTRSRVLWGAFGLALLVMLFVLYLSLIHI